MGTGSNEGGGRIDGRDGVAEEHEDGLRRGPTPAPVNSSRVRSRLGLKAVAASLMILAATALVQSGVFVRSGSIALLADMVHNGGDALTAIPLGVAFTARSTRAERRAGHVIIATILVSALVAAAAAIERFMRAQRPNHLLAVAVAGVIGFSGNELAARIRLRAGARLRSAALVADGQHARADGYVSLGVVGSAIVVALGARVADPIIGLVIAALILKTTVDAWQTIHRHTDERRDADRTVDSVGDCRRPRRPTS